MNAGIRWEGQNVRNRDKETAFDLKDNWAPRIGFVWDVARNNRSKLYANWGRFYESIPMDINIRAFGGEVQCFCYNFSPDPANYLQDPAAPRPQSLLGGRRAGRSESEGTVHRRMARPASNTISARNLVVGAKYGHRKLGRVIEDFLIPRGRRTTSSPIRAAASAPKWASTTACTRRPHRRPSGPTRRSR